MENLVSSSFTLLLDMPNVNNIYFGSNGEITSLPPGLHETYEFGVPLFLEIDVEFINNTWTIWLDGELVHSDGHWGNRLQGFRWNLPGNHAAESTGLDNIRVYGENLPAVHVCCIGEECLLTDHQHCTDLGGEYHFEWDSCGPPNPCEGGTAASETSWGRIKSTYK